MHNGHWVQIFVKIRKSKVKMEMNKLGSLMPYFFGNLFVVLENLLVMLESLSKSIGRQYDNVFVGAPSLSHTSVENQIWSTTLKAPELTSCGNGVNELDEFTTLNFFKSLHIQIKFWKLFNHKFLTWAFFYVNDGRSVDLINM